MKKYIIVAVLITSATVYADPVYLECSILGEELENGRVDIKVRLDESDSKVSHSTDKLIFNADGIWSANAVRYKHVSGGEYLVPLIIQEFRINRATLEITKTITIQYPEKFNTPADLLGPWSGDCTIIETRQNKI